jgi:hypothetical protein
MNITRAVRERKLLGETVRMASATLIFMLSAVSQAAHATEITARAALSRALR